MLSVWRLPRSVNGREARRTLASFAATRWYSPRIAPTAAARDVQMHVARLRPMSSALPPSSSTVSAVRGAPYQ